VEPYGQKLLGKMEKGKSSRNTIGVSKRQWRTVSSRLVSNNLYNVLYPEKLGNKLNSTNMTKRVRDVWHILQLLREVWMKLGLKKLESHEGITVKTLLNSRVTGLFIDIAFAKEKGFKMEKLKKPLLQNVDRTANIEEAITHQVECNMFFKGHVEKVTMNVYNLGKTRIILDILWLTTHNLEIDWEKGEVKIMQCLPICGKRKQKVKEKEIKKAKNDKDKKVLKKLVSKKF